MELLTKVFEYLRKRSYIFLIAAAIESPRLIYSFGSFRENQIAGIFLALLSTYALSETFENYFKHRDRILLLILGVWYFIKALVYNEADDKYMTFLIVGWIFFFAIIYKNLIL